VQVVGKRQEDEKLASIAIVIDRVLKGDQLAKIQ
jgi:hypothetical protein